jgi:hypothetical protein
MWMGWMMKRNAKMIKRWMKKHTIQDLKAIVLENYAEEEAPKILALINDLDDLSRSIRMLDPNEENVNYDTVDKKVSLEA